MLRAVAREEEPRFKAVLNAHHYLGAVAKIGHTLWYVATWQGQWLALLVVGAAAWKCAARDRWIGWDRRYQYDRLHLIGNNVRFLILPDAHVPNLASRVLALLERRVSADWHARFGHPLWLLETFVDPRRFHGTSYRAANWLAVGESRGFRRTRGDFPLPIFDTVLNGITIRGSIVGTRRTRREGVRAPFMPGKGKCQPMARLAPASGCPQLETGE